MVSNIVGNFLVIACVVSGLILNTFGQAYYCHKRAMASLRTIPKLRYACREGENDYGEAILKFPERVSAIRRYTKALETFNNPAWWTASVDDLTYCDSHRKVGPLTKKEKADLKGGEYLYRLFGDHQIRVISAADPCFQTGFGGSDVYLLYHQNTRVYATEIIDGFSSRADNPFSVDFAMLGKEKLIEIASSTGGLYPMVINYYFTIDKRTNRAVPKNLFKDEKGLTNTITSMMLLEEPEEYGLPPKTEPLVIFKNGRMNRSFVVLDDIGEKVGNDKHAAFKNTTLRWNGKFFE